MPTYPQTSPALSVQVLLKQPTRISRDLASLVYQRLITPSLFVKGSPDEVRGGAMQYQQSESIFLDSTQDVEEIAVRGAWPRVGWTEALKTAAVKQYGLEVPISNLSIRRNQISQFQRAMRKLANNIVRFVDTQAIALLTDTAQGINTGAAAAAWSIAGTDIIGEIAAMQEAIETKNNGYSGFNGAVLVLHTTRRKDLLNNTALRAALPREAQNGQIQSGVMAPFLGLSDIKFTSNITTTQALLLDPTVAATIAYEEPDPAEGFAGYDPGANFAPIWTKVYEDPRPKDQIVAGGIWPGMAFTDPGAVYLRTGI
jgi:hypothetical protein